jgi:methionyl-tRNA synthetase
MMNTIPLVPILPAELFGEQMIVEEADIETATAATAPFKASRFVVKPGQRSEIDKHAVKECWFIAQGEGRLICNGTVEGKVSAGDVLFYDSFQSHQVINTSTENELLIFAVWWK